MGLHIINKIIVFGSQENIGLIFGKLVQNELSKEYNYKIILIFNESNFKLFTERKKFFENKRIKGRKNYVEYQHKYFREQKE